MPASRTTSNMETTRAPVEYLLAFVAYTATMLFCFRLNILHGFDLGFSDQKDGFIEISILEHWHNVYRGYSNWLTPFYFYPYTGSLGYNDGYFLYGAIYSFFRIFSDPFLADTLNIFTFKSIGFFSTFYLFRKIMGRDVGEALLAAALFSTANGIAIQSGHQQMQSIALQPLLLILTVKAWRAELAGARGAARAWGGGAAALLAAWLMTSYYFAWYFIFFASVLCLIWSILKHRLDWRPLWHVVANHGATILVVAAVFGLLCLPFLWTYLPKLKESGGNDWPGIVLAYPSDIINVGPKNLLWGWLGNSSLMRSGEHRVGFPLFLFGLLGTALFIAIRGSNHGGFEGRPTLLKALALTILASWMLGLGFDFIGRDDLSPWHLVRWLIPGALGVRAIPRFHMFLFLPALILISYTLNGRWQWLKRNVPLAAAALATLLLLETVNSEIPLGISRSTNLAELGAIPLPPANCRSFYVVSARRVLNPDHVFPQNADAMLLAELWRLPTPLGWSTFSPRDWDFQNSASTDYDARVLAYARRHALHDVCRLDMRQASPWRHEIV